MSDNFFSTVRSYVGTRITNPLRRIGDRSEVLTKGRASIVFVLVHSASGKIQFAISINWV